MRWEKRGSGHSRELSGLIVSNFTDDFASDSVGGFGRFQLMQLQQRSLLQIYAESDSGDPINAFVRLNDGGLENGGSRSVLEVDILREINPGDNVLVHDIFIDGKLVVGAKRGKKIRATSSDLSHGNHVWQVASSIISGRIYSGLTKSISIWKNTIEKLKSQMNGPSAGGNRMANELEILRLEKQISSAKSQIQLEKKAASVPVSLVVEVQ